MNGESLPISFPRQRRAKKVPNDSFDQCLSAFPVLSTVLLSTFPHRAVEMFAYLNIIHSVHKKFLGLSWFAYDIDFKGQPKTQPPLELSLLRKVNSPPQSYHTASTYYYGCLPPEPHQCRELINFRSMDINKVQTVHNTIAQNLDHTGLSIYRDSKPSISSESDNYVEESCLRLLTVCCSAPSWVG